MGKGKGTPDQWVAVVRPGRIMFEMEGVKLTFPEESLRSIARRAIDRKTGARGLRSIMELILLETMFDLPTMNGVEEVVISKEVVDGDAKPLLIYADREKQGNAKLAPAASA